MLFQEALDRANQYFGQLDRDMKTVEALDAGEKWIFIGGYRKELRMGSRKVWIAKESGHMEEFYLPSEEGFALMKNAAEIEL